MQAAAAVLERLVTALRLPVVVPAAALLAEADELVREGETLLAELKLPEAGVGKLKSHQCVKLKYDAFPYQRHGVRYGRVA